MLRFASSAGPKSALVVGSMGQLGKEVMARFGEAGWNTLGFDASAGESAAHVQLPADAGWLAQAEFAASHVAKEHGGGFDAVVVTAGGWAGGGVGDAAGLQSVDDMWAACVQSAALGGHLAVGALRPGGMLVFTGAAAAGGGGGGAGTVGMAGYGMAKAATHHLAQNLGASDELPAGSSVAALLPATIDTPMNRQFMPDADHSTWTPMPDMAAKILQWSEESAERPPSGALIAVTTSGGVTTFEAAQA